MRNINFVRKPLVAALRKLAGQVPKRSPKQALECVRIRQDETGTYIAATDLESYAEVQIDSFHHFEEISFLVPFQALKDFASKSKRLSIDLACSDATISLSDGSASVQLDTKPVDDFPIWAEMLEQREEIRVDAADFAAAIQRTLFAAAKESSRYALDCILFKVDDHTLRLVATDGCRLSVSETGCEKLGTMPDLYPRTDGTERLKSDFLLVSAATCKLLAKFLKTEKDAVSIWIDERSILFVGNSFRLQTNLRPGRFFRWRDIFPGTANYQVELQVPQLLAAVSQAKQFTSEDCLGFDFAFGPGRLTLRSQNCEIPLEISYFEEAFVVALNPIFVEQYLKSLGKTDSTVTIEVIDDRKAVVFRFGDDKHLVMPLTRERARSESRRYETVGV